MIRLTVRVTPRAGRDSIDGFAPDGRLLIHVSAAPADGAANKAVVRLLSRMLGVPSSRIAIAAGKTSRIKTIEVADLGEDDIRSRLGHHNP